MTRRPSMKAAESSEADRDERADVSNPPGQ